MSNYVIYTQKKHSPECFFSDGSPWRPSGCFPVQGQADSSVGMSLGSFAYRIRGDVPDMSMGDRISGTD